MSSRVVSLDLTARVQPWRPEVKTTEVEACMATSLWFIQLRTFNSRLLTTVVEVLQVSAMNKQHHKHQKPS